MRKHRFAFVPEHEPLLRRAQMRSTQELLRKRGSIVARSSSSETLRIEISGEAPRLFLKRQHVLGARRKWRGFFRNTFFGRSRTRAEWEVLLRLHDEGLNPIEPVAFGEIRTLRFLDHGFLVTFEMVGSTPLDDYIPRVLVRSSETERRAFIFALARFVAKLHGSGFVDRDLHWRNLLVRSSRTESVELGKVDSPRGSWPRSRTGRLRGQLEDLAALDLHAPRYFRRAERLRFLHTYDEELPEDAARQRDLARRLLTVRPEVEQREGWRPLRGEV